MSKLVTGLRIVSRSVWSNPGNRHQLVYRTFRAINWQITKRLTGRPRLITVASGAKMMAYPDCVVSSAVIYSDWPEYHEIQFLRRHLKRGEVVIDVGANVGHLLLLLSDVGTPEKFFAFEPTPVTFRRLRENWCLNGWPVENLFPAAVGAKPGNIFINNIPKPDSTNAVRAERINREDVQTEMKTLDQLCAKWPKGGVGLLIIDVEGYEPQVFAGASELLNKIRPRIIMFESLNRRLDTAIGDMLSAARYRVFQLDEQGGIDTNRADAQNLLASPEELFPGLNP